jgi:hypothetical protein
MENEKAQLPFPDVNIERKATTFTYNLYRKPMQTNRMLNFRSHHPQHVKRNIITNEVKRIESLSSTANQKSQNICHLKEALRANEFPEHIINKGMRAQEPKEKTTENETVVIPYIGPQAYQIKRLLANYNIQTFFSNAKTIQQIYKPKASQTEAPHNVVYKVECESCEKWYIGQTKKKFVERKQQHERSITKLEETNAFAAHNSETGHLPNWNSVKIIFQEKNYFHRLALEAATIEYGRKKVINLESGRFKEITRIVPSNFQWPGGATVPTASNEATQPITGRNSVQTNSFKCLKTGDERPPK